MRVLLSGALSGVLAAFLFGFIVFASRVTSHERLAHEVADGIVVLTGEGGRIDAGARLLASGHAGRMLISGVNRRLGREEIRRLTGIDARDFECCIDIGYFARDTAGNADEARAWAREHNFTSLIIVTASYHMPRSLIEFGRRMPAIRLFPHALVPKRLRSDAWWLRFGSTRLLLSEYLKLLPSAARGIAEGVFRPADSGSRSSGPATAHL